MDKLRYLLGSFFLYIALKVLPKDMGAMIKEAIRKRTEFKLAIFNSAVTGEPLVVDLRESDKDIKLIDTIILKAPYIEIEENIYDKARGMVYTTNKYKKLKITLLRQ